MHRRRFFDLAAAGFAAFQSDAVQRAQAAAQNASGRAADSLARDEDFWFQVRHAFTVDRNMINLNNGGVSPSPKVVMETEKRYLEISNMGPSYYMWRIVEPEVESVRRRLAQTFGCDTEEIAITRNASEALEIVQLGMDLKAGDEVLTTNQDYPRMITTWEQRARRDGIVLKQIPFPVPAPGLDDLYERLERAITPRTRVLHICHITNRTGQIFPVRKVSRMARERGIEVIVDGAHAFGHFPFKRDDLDCDYYGTSLHKWLLAPVGTGFLYVRRERIRGLWPLMAAPTEMDGNIRKFEEIGTHPAANHNAISVALVFHRAIGAERKIERLRYLRDRWAKRLLQESDRVQVLTPLDSPHSGAIACFHVDGIDTAKLHSWLFDKHRIVTTPILHPEFQGLRITPNVYTTPDQIDLFAETVLSAIRKGIA
jgi:selenocysteine lyase/cysteine desulfurase